MFTGGAYCEMRLARVHHIYRNERGNGQDLDVQKSALRNEGMALSFHVHVNRMG